MDHIWEEGGDSIWWNTSEEKLLHPHHINIIWARKPGPGLEAKIATYMSSTSSSLSHHRMNIEQFHVDFRSEQNHWDVFVFLSRQNCPHAIGDCLLPGHLHRQVWDFQSQGQIQIMSGCPVFSFLTLWLTRNTQVTTWKHFQHDIHWFAQEAFVNVPSAPTASWPCIDCIPIWALTNVNVFPTTRSQDLLPVVSEFTIHCLSPGNWELSSLHFLMISFSVAH